MTLHRKCCCGPDMCWHQLIECCPGDGIAYIQCSVATRAGIVPTFGTSVVFKHDGICYSAALFEGEPPDGATILGSEVIGNVDIFDNCTTDPGGCCEEPRCWYTAVKCCDTADYCVDWLESQGVPTPPEVFYTPCEFIEDAQFEATLPPFPFTVHLQWYAEFPDCIPCYTFTGSVVNELPPGAVENLGGWNLVANCDVEECCPESEEGGCSSACAMPTHILMNVSTPAEEFSTCPCDQPESPQAWLIGNFINDIFSCTDDSAITFNGCHFRYALLFECQPVVVDLVTVAIYYQISIQFFNAATIGPDDPDCVACGFSQVDQTCAESCPQNYQYLIRTPDLPITACPHAADFTIVIPPVIGAPVVDILGFVY